MCKNGCFWFENVGQSHVGTSFLCISNFTGNVLGFSSSNIVTLNLLLATFNAAPKFFWIRRILAFNILSTNLLQCLLFEINFLIYSNFSRYLWSTLMSIQFMQSRIHMNIKTLFYVTPSFVTGITYEILQ